MKILFLFYTQAELGAPGYLSKEGESAAETLAQNIAQFSVDALGIDLQAENLKDSVAHFVEDKPRSAKTAEFVTSFIPIPLTKQGVEKIPSFLEEVASDTSRSSQLRLVLVGTSLEQLKNWSQNKVTEEQFAQLSSTLDEMTHQDKFPTVFVAGYDHGEWLLDL